MGDRRGWLPAALVLALLVTGTWGLAQRARAERAEGMLAAQFQHSFYDLLGHVENVSVLLSKSRVAASPGQTTLLLNDAWSQALTAQARLNALPVATATRQRTSTFLTQTGDFAQMMAGYAARGIDPAPEVRQALAELQTQADRLAQELHGIAEEANRGRLRWHEVQRMTSADLADTPTEPLGEGITRIEQGLMEYPTLLYDGPFSDHVTRRAPRTVPDTEVSAEAARAIAAEFLRLAVGTIDEGALRLAGEIDGRIPAFRFQWAEGDGEPVRIDVARRGGEVIWMVDPRPTEGSRLSAEEAIERARTFAAALGFESVEAVFPLRVPGRMLVPLAPVQDGVIHYPDQVKATVSLEDGRILSYVAVDYLMNRGPRPIPEDVLREEEARARLRSELDVLEDGRLAWILNHALKEHLTYEFPVALDGQEFLVYVDAVDGDEVRIEKVIGTEEGPLVM